MACATGSARRHGRARALAALSLLALLCALTALRRGWRLRPASPRRDHDHHHHHDARDNITTTVSGHNETVAALDAATALAGAPRGTRWADALARIVRETAPAGRDGAAPRDARSWTADVEQLYAQRYTRLRALYGPGCSTAQRDELRLLVLTHNAWGSAKMKGWVMCEVLRDDGRDARCARWPPVAAAASALAALRPPAACVFVKFVSPRLARECRRRGALVLWDMLDNNVYRRECRTACRPDVDVYLANSFGHADELEQCCRARAVPLWHPHTNSAQCRSPAPRLHEAPARALAPGIDAQIDAPTYAALARHLGTLGVALEREPPASPARRGASAVADQCRYHTPLDAHVALIPPPPAAAADGRHARRRPANRLAKMFSHGLPTVFYPYQGYRELAAFFDYNATATSVDEFAEWVRALRSERLRGAMSARAFAAARYLSAQRQAELYTRLVCALADERASRA